MDDDVAMQRAIELGERARIGAAGDPWVGCVLVAGGEVVGEGAHDRHGGPHAEVIALASAGDAAEGATAYVTLEPCDHRARTAPCTDALVEAGVARVVAALEDPDPRVGGRGVARLRRAGVAVEVGLGGDAAAASLRPYLHQRTTGRPWCVLKAAVSLDGRSAAADGSSRWITGPEARADAHRLRAGSQAVVVGSGTALADRPRLTVRDSDERPSRPPWRVVLDARGRVPAEGPLFDLEAAPTTVVTTAGAPAEVVAAWKDRGAEVEVVAPGSRGGVDTAEALEVLGRRGVVQALVEGGARLHGALLGADAVDELVLYVSGLVLGDSGRPLAAGLDVGSIGEARGYELADVARLGDDVRLRYLRGPGRP